AAGRRPVGSPPRAAGARLPGQTREPLMRLRQLLRVGRINLVLLRHGLDELLLDVPLFRPVRWLKLFMFWRWLKAPSGTRGERIRGALEDLGPIFIKFGQILSTRRDLLPPDIAAELARL